MNKLRSKSWNLYIKKMRPRLRLHARVRALATTLWFLVSLIAVLLSVPVVLLPLITGVPLWLALGLALVNVILLVTVTRVQRTPLVKGLALIGGFAIVAAIAIVLSQVMAYTPHKELIWFEQSGHPPLYSEASKVVDVMVNQVLAQSFQ
jgi:hypothetical protein